MAGEAKCHHQWSPFCHFFTFSAKDCECEKELDKIRSLSSLAATYFARIVRAPRFRVGCGGRSNVTQF